MTTCDLFESPDIELYFYDELGAGARARVEAHVRGCEACRQRLADLAAIRRALAARPAVEAPPAGDWSGFMRRLDEAVVAETASGAGPSTSRTTARPVSGANVGVGARRTWTWRPAVALAAMLALVTMGVVIAARFRAAPRAAQITQASPAPAVQPQSPPQPATSPDRSLREVSAEHLEKSKLVVLGLATLDPQHTKSSDWKFERQLAGTLLTDTRLYRMQAQDRGLTDVARVMRDLETVLIETSMSEGSDRDALPRVQRLIARRDLVVKMQVVAASSAGL
jgi:hypothetical protein